MAERWILHCDCNSFYASVELLSHPELRRKPVAVCGDPASRHGIVLAKNEPAKALGVKTLEFLENQPFRGNIRELQNLIQRLMIMTDYQIIEVRDVLQALSADLSEAGAPAGGPPGPALQGGLGGGAPRGLPGVGGGGGVGRRPGEGGPPRRWGRRRSRC